MHGETIRAGMNAGNMVGDPPRHHHSGDLAAWGAAMGSKSNVSMNARHRLGIEAKVHLLAFVLLFNVIAYYHVSLGRR